MEITITRVDGALSVRPGPPYLVDYLQYHHRGFKVVNYRRVNDFEQRLLHQAQPDGSLITFPGFFDKILELCHENHDTVRIVDNRSTLPPVNWQAIRDINWQGIGSTGLRDYQIEPISEFLVKAQHSSGIVNAAGGFGKTIVQAVTYAAFSGLNTILAIPLKEVYSQTYEKFRLMFPNKHIGRVGDGYHDISPDITITTFKSLKSCAVEKCKLLLIDELQSTAGNEISSTLCQMHPARVFGYTATDKGMFNKAEKLIKGLFGERLIYIPYKDAEESNAVVPVSVWFIKMPTDIMISANSMEGRLRMGIKRCKRRNEIIGRVCQLVPNKWQTLIFVDHIEDHLIPLHKELPAGTKFIHRNSDKALGDYTMTPKQQKAVIAEYQQNDVQFLMATDAFRAGVDIPNCRVVIQASGGTSEVELLQEAYRGSRILTDRQLRALGVEQKTHMVLIDFLDLHEPALESMSRKRMEIYRKQGWSIHEVNSPDEIDWNYHCATKHGEE
jgi:superfamily II DNA or RNA helicase